MAKINPRDINRGTECYAAVEWEIGFRCGHVKDGKLYSLENPKYYMIMPESPNFILAAFETQEELEQWRRDLYKEPEPDEVEPKTKNTGKPKYSFTYFYDLFTPTLRADAQQWAEAETKDMYGDELMAWAKARMTVEGLREHETRSTTLFYVSLEQPKAADKAFDYGSFLNECAIACKLFYFGNGGEGIPNVISEGKNGSGKFIVSSIL
ncbi:hypothetical protein [Pontibacter akesuensis]|uniref:Uncharacterized protein n=1 Tax=Pontibacter akesuensis TaxID=388950 RepID=A0A1I7IMK8_9BACT|nr:hypothetical protein [Pontibacter akesuensis]GHA67887.1 hypothetical protein GCM10007389_21550 [Pontibacter akesuensis]SFU74148.1 hypothetical protein SAMN04487941_2326 [Pontibacter akesuensis]